MPTLTIAGVARIKPPKHGQADHFDRGYPGLALRVSYGGTKTWVFFYRLHGKQRRLTLGRYPAVQLGQARDAWRIAHLAVKKGEDPTYNRPTTADLFAAVADEWLDRHQGKNCSVAEVRRVIEREVLPVWGDRPIANISRRDIIELIDKVVDRGATTMARRLHAHLHTLFRWAKGRGILTTNPMTDLPKPGQAVKRDRVLTNDELSAIWKAVKETSQPFGPIVQLLALTAARRAEIGSLVWSEVHGAEIRIPGERSKNTEPRIIPLTPAAAKLIQDMPRIGAEENSFVFTTTGKTPVSGWSKAKKELDAAAAKFYGRPLAPWVLHDLRRTAATGMERIGVRQQVVERILGHTSGSRAGIVGVYQRYHYEPEKRAALTLWGREIERIASAGGHAIAPAAATLTLSTFAPTVEVKLTNMEWAQAVMRADKETSPEPLLDYLRHRPSGTKFEPADISLLQDLLERMNFTRKDSGRFVPIGEKSRTEINEIGAAYVRKLKLEAAARGEKLSHEKAIEITVQARPDLFGADGESEAFVSHMRRGY